MSLLRKSSGLLQLKTSEIDEYLHKFYNLVLESYVSGRGEKDDLKHESAINYVNYVQKYKNSIFSPQLSIKKFRDSPYIF